MSKALVLIILPLVLGCAHALAQDTVQIVSTAAQQVRTKPAPVADAQQITDEQICRMRIAAYKDNYNGPCPCPYNTKSNGSKCDGNSDRTQLRPSITLAAALHRHRQILAARQTWAR